MGGDGGGPKPFRFALKLDTVTPNPLGFAPKRTLGGGGGLRPLSFTLKMNPETPQIPQCVPKGTRGGGGPKTLQIRLKNGT